MSGTETYAAGGAISGGWDSFTWDQNAYDQATLSDSQSTTTSSPSSETNYSMILHDTVSDTMYDVGSDVLGASDSIVSNGDSDTIIDSRQLTSTVVDAGSSVTPYEVEGTGSDNYVMTDTGTSTLSASGQTFGTDTVTYNESSNDNALDTESFGAYSYVWGSASDTYSDSDVSTITDSNGVTTSVDNFVLFDSHSVFGGDEGSSVNSTMEQGWVDNGIDVETSSISGTTTPTGVALSFSDTETSSDVGSSNESIYNQYTASGGNNSVSVNELTGTYSSGAWGSQYAALTSTTLSVANWDSGTIEVGGTSYRFETGGVLSETYEYTVTGPPPTTTTLISVSVYTANTSDATGPGGAFGPIPATGTAVSAPFGTASQLGFYPVGGVHNGSDNRGFDETEGLASAVGGQDVHGLEFTGGEEQAVAYNGTIGVDDQDGPFTGQDGRQPTAWQSHPSTIGYVRGNQSSGNGAGTQGADMDSGTRDGTPADELARLSNFSGGSELNPTSAQPAPTPRAEQEAATPSSPGASAAAANPGNVGNKDGANAAGGGGGGASGGGGSAMTSGVGGGGSGSGDNLADIMSPNNGPWGNRPWAPGINPFTGNGTYNPFPGLVGSGSSPNGGGGGGNGPVMAAKPKNRGGPGPGSTANSPPSADPTPQPTAPPPVNTPPGSQVSPSPSAAPQPPTSSIPLVPLQPQGGDQQPTPYPAPLSLDDLLGMGRGDDVPAMGTPSGISASVIANTRPVSWVFAGLFGGFIGFGHGSMMVTNAFTGGVIPGLDRDVKNIIQENGGAYAAANFSAGVGATFYNIANVGSGALQLANIAKGGQALVTTTGRLLPSAAAVAGIAEGGTRMAVGVGISVAATGNLPPNFAMMSAGSGGGAGGGAPNNPPLKTKIPLDRTPYAKDPRSAPASATTPDGGYVYVRDASGTVQVAPDGPHMHPKVLGGAQPASYAGDMTIGNGIIIDLTNLSGTFQFKNRAGLLDAAKQLESQGLTIKPGAVRFFPPDGSPPVTLR